MNLRVVEAFHGVVTLKSVTRGRREVAHHAVGDPSIEKNR